MPISVRRFVKKKKGLCNPICYCLYTSGRIVQWAAAGRVDKHKNNDSNNDDRQTCYLDSNSSELEIPYYNY
jgi:hypothetical protein